MKKQLGYSLVEAFVLILILLVATGWCMNLYKLVKTDFEAPYKAEAIRLVGLVPPVGAIVGWIDIEDGPQ